MLVISETKQITKEVKVYDRDGWFQRKSIKYLRTMVYILYLIPIYAHYKELE